MRAPQDVIVKPIVTEKSIGAARIKKYTFKVATDANKIEIAYAVEHLFHGVKVAKVNTLHCKGRFKRMGAHTGYKPNWKKAVVTLTENSKTIEFFDSMM